MHPVLEGTERFLFRGGGCLTGGMKRLSGGPTVPLRTLGPSAVRPGRAPECQDHHLRARNDTAATAQRQGVVPGAAKTLGPMDLTLVHTNTCRKAVIV
jgi:hypothetical protein